MLHAFTDQPRGKLRWLPHFPRCESRRGARHQHVSHGPQRWGEDDDGQGHWFPCQTAGVRSFAAIDDLRPILQKGDNFKNPENLKERQRFVTDYFAAAGRSGKPQVEFISELVVE